MITRGLFVVTAVMAAPVHAEPRVALPYPTPLYATDAAARSATTPGVDPAAPGPSYQLASAVLLAHDGTVAKLRLAANTTDCLPAFSAIHDITVYVPERMLVTRLAAAQSWSDATGAWHAAAGAPLVKTAAGWAVNDETMAALQPATIALSGALGVNASALPKLARTTPPRCPRETKATCEERMRQCRQKARDLMEAGSCDSCTSIPDECGFAARSAIQVGAASAPVDRTRSMFTLGLAGGAQIVDYAPNACFVARGTLSAPPVFAERSGGSASVRLSQSKDVPPASVTIRKGTKLYWADGTVAGKAAMTRTVLERNLTAGDNRRRCFTERWLDSPLCF